MNYHDKRFRPQRTSTNSQVSAEVIFHYIQEGQIVTSRYSGGNIVQGHLIGIVDPDGNIDMRYHQVGKNGELMTGICRSVPSVGSNGQLLLNEYWQWTSGDYSAGTSVLEEI